MKEHDKGPRKEQSSEFPQKVRANLHRLQEVHTLLERKRTDQETGQEINQEQRELNIERVDLIRSLRLSRTIQQQPETQRLVEDINRRLNEAVNTEEVNTLATALEDLGKKRKGRKFPKSVNTNLAEFVSVQEKLRRNPNSAELAHRRVDLIRSLRLSRTIQQQPETQRLVEDINRRLNEAVNTEEVNELEAALLQLAKRVASPDASSLGVASLPGAAEPDDNTLPPTSPDSPASYPQNPHAEEIGNLYDLLTTINTTGENNSPAETQKGMQDFTNRVVTLFDSLTEDEQNQIHQLVSVMNADQALIQAKYEACLLLDSELNRLYTTATNDVSGATVVEKLGAIGDQAVKNQLLSKFSEIYRNNTNAVETDETVIRADFDWAKAVVNALHITPAGPLDITQPGHSDQSNPGGFDNSDSVPSGQGLPGVELDGRDESGLGDEGSASVPEHTPTIEELDNLLAKIQAAGDTSSLDDVNNFINGVDQVIGTLTLDKEENFQTPEILQAAQNLLEEMVAYYRTKETNEREYLLPDGKSFREEHNKIQLKEMPDEERMQAIEDLLGKAMALDTNKEVLSDPEVLQAYFILQVLTFKKLKEIQAAESAGDGSGSPDDSSDTGEHDGPSDFASAPGNAPTSPSASGGVTGASSADSGPAPKNLPKGGTPPGGESFSATAAVEAMTPVEERELYSSLDRNLAGYFRAFLMQEAGAFTEAAGEEMAQNARVLYPELQRLPNANDLLAVIDLNVSGDYQKIAEKAANLLAKRARDNEDYAPESVVRLLQGLSSEAQAKILDFFDNSSRLKELVVKTPQTASINAENARRWIGTIAPENNIAPEVYASQLVTVANLLATTPDTAGQSVQQYFINLVNQDKGETGIGLGISLAGTVEATFPAVVKTGEVAETERTEERMQTLSTQLGDYLRDEMIRTQFETEGITNEEFLSSIRTYEVEEITQLADILTGVDFADMPERSELKAILANDSKSGISASDRLVVRNAAITEIGRFLEKHPDFVPELLVKLLEGLNTERRESILELFADTPREQLKNRITTNRTVKSQEDAADFWWKGPSGDTKIPVTEYANGVGAVAEMLDTESFDEGQSVQRRFLNKIIEEEEGERKEEIERLLNERFPKTVSVPTSESLVATQPGRPAIVAPVASVPSRYTGVLAQPLNSAKREGQTEPDRGGTDTMSATVPVSVASETSERPAPKTLGEALGDNLFIGPIIRELKEREQAEVTIETYLKIVGDAYIGLANRQNVTKILSGSEDESAFTKLVRKRVNAMGQALAAQGISLENSTPEQLRAAAKAALQEIYRSDTQRPGRTVDVNDPNIRYLADIYRAVKAWDEVKKLIPAPKSPATPETPEPSAPAPRPAETVSKEKLEGLQNRAMQEFNAAAGEVRRLTTKDTEYSQAVSNVVVSALQLFNQPLDGIPDSVKADLETIQSSLGKIVTTNEQGYITEATKAIEEGLLGLVDSTSTLEQRREHAEKVIRAFGKLVDGVQAERITKQGLRTVDGNKIRENEHALGIDTSAHTAGHHPKNEVDAISQLKIHLTETLPKAAFREDGQDPIESLDREVLNRVRDHYTNFQKIVEELFAAALLPRSAEQSAQPERPDIQKLEREYRNRVIAFDNGEGRELLETAGVPEAKQKEIIQVVGEIVEGLYAEVPNFNNLGIDWNSSQQTFEERIAYVVKNRLHLTDNLVPFITQRLAMREEECNYEAALILAQVSSYSLEEFRRLRSTDFDTQLEEVKTQYEAYTNNSTNEHAVEEARQQFLLSLARYLQLGVRYRTALAGVISTYDSFIYPKVFGAGGKFIEVDHSPSSYDGFSTTHGYRIDHVKEARNKAIGEGIIDMLAIQKRAAEILVEQYSQTLSISEKNKARVTDALANTLVAQIQAQKTAADFPAPHVYTFLD